MYFHSLEKFHRNSTWKNSIYQETSVDDISAMMKTMFHVFRRIIALYRPQGQTQKGGWLGSWKHGPWNTGLASGMNAAYILAECSWDFPRREQPGVETRGSGLCQCGVLGKTDQKEFCSLQSGIKAGRRVDSAHQSNRGCRSPDPLHQISYLVTHSGTCGATIAWSPTLGWSARPLRAKVKIQRHRTWDSWEASENSRW